MNLVSPDNRITLPAGTGRTSFVTASDIGDAAAEALLGDHHGEIWTLTGPEALDHHQVAAILSDATGRDVGYDDVPAPAFSQMLTQYAGTDPAKAEALSRVYSQDVAQDAYATVSDDLPRVLGRPATPFPVWASANAASIGG